MNSSAKKRQNRIAWLIESSAKPFGATIIEFDYNAKYFGNFILKIRDRFGIEHEYINDRWEIYVKNQNLSIPPSHDWDDEDAFWHFLCSLLAQIIKDLLLSNSTNFSSNNE